MFRSSVDGKGCDTTGIEPGLFNVIFRAESVADVRGKSRNANVISRGTSTKLLVARQSCRFDERAN